MPETTIDSLPVASLPDRYGIARSVLYNRLTDLKIETEKRGNKAYVSADQLQLLDELHQHIQAGSNTAEFLASHGLTNRQTGLSGEQSVGQLAVMEPSALMAALMSAFSVVQPPQSDSLTNLERLEKACSHGWLLSTSQLAPLLGLKSLTGKKIHRYGFTFTRVGRNGAESAWAIAKTSGNA